jgi:hypothetical protein
MTKLKRYRLLNDVSGRPIHSSPPSAPWCPAVYEGPNGQLIVVGKRLRGVGFAEISRGVGPQEEAVILEHGLLARLVELVNQGCLVLSSEKVSEGSRSDVLDKNHAGPRSSATSRKPR